MKDNKHFRFDQINRAMERLSNNKDFVDFLGQNPQTVVKEELFVLKKNGEFLAIPQNGNTPQKGIFYIDSFYGQDCFSYDKKSTSTYWILAGKGEFTIAGIKRKVKAGDKVVIPNNTIFYYCGDMQLVEKMEPNFEEGNVVQVGDLIDYQTDGSELL